MDGKVKSFRCKARESLGMSRTYKYAAVTKDEAEHRRWTFYEAVIFKPYNSQRDVSVFREKYP